MSQMRLWVAASIIGLVILAGFVLSVPHTRDVDVVRPQTAAKEGPPVITMRDSFKKGVHTITGSLEVPNACAIVSATATTTADGIRVSISTHADAGVCLELPARAAFSTTISAPARLPLSASVDGVLASTTSL